MFKSSHSPSYFVEEMRGWNPHCYWVIHRKSRNKAFWHLLVLFHLEGKWKSPLNTHNPPHYGNPPSFQDPSQMSLLHNQLFSLSTEITRAFHGNNDLCLIPHPLHPESLRAGMVSYFLWPFRWWYHIYFLCCRWAENNYPSIFLDLEEHLPQPLCLHCLAWFLTEMGLI